MTKIVFEAAAFQAERHASNTTDLARRLEWRLQWEKAQVENWQISQHNGRQQTDATGLPAEASEKGLKARYEAFTQMHLASDKLLVVTTETRGINRPDNHQSRLIYESSSAKHPETPTAHSVISPANGEGAGRPIFNTTKSTQTVRPMSSPPYRQSQPTGVHIYQVDGTVEVALRSIGLNGKDGVMLMKGLKSDLASLGLKLTRLILNGELLWQTETISPNDLAFSGAETDEAPIDKIY